jgi:hypothetical protein
LYVKDWSPIAEQKSVDRFARLFRNVFNSIPPDDGGLLLFHWESICKGHPNIELVAETEYLDDWLLPAEAWAQFPGHVVRFRRAAMDAWPDDLVETVIAHELGHVFAMASGLTFTTVESCEKYANACAGAWGYELGWQARKLPSEMIATPAKKKSKHKKKKKEKFSYV